ncbi:MAG: transglycosylase domain-containing protein [Cyanobacteriota bacterium]|nr:transglycosylase domain-containing protein [Cyanobacteriota bacterium]
MRPSTAAAATLDLIRSHRYRALRQTWARLRARSAIAELWLGETLITRLTLQQERYRIGRDPDCELSVAASGLSRVHAILERAHPSDRDFTLEDFHSSNGLFHRDRRIRSIQLRDGDAVWLGSPLKGDAPVLRYHQPPSALERVARWCGLVGLVGSAVLVGSMLAAASVAGGSEIRSIAGPVKIHASDGTKVDPKQGSATALPSLQSYPLHLRQALIASEDARFGWNSGLDLFGTLRAALTRRGGGSGLSQQVARMYYAEVGRDISLMRKLRELWVALQLEVGFSKNRILKMYLDRAHLGLGTDGFEQAAQLYFRRSASELDLAQSAFLVGLLPSPNGYSPCRALYPDQEAARLEETLNQRRSGRLSPGDQARIEAVRRGEWLPVQRRNLVLKLMHEQGYLGIGPQADQVLRDAQRKPLNIDPSACREAGPRAYPFFSDYVIGELEGRRFGLHLDEATGGNYYVESTIEPSLQALAQDQLRRFLDGPAAAVGLSQGALITIRPSSGEILAYVGGGDYRRSSFDRVQALRQPGSTFKLFPFLAALEAGVQPSQPISCAPLAYVKGCRGGRGSTTLRDGFAHSENVVALRLAQKAGAQQVLKQARLLGISTPLDPDFNTFLGGRETYLYELARAYAVVANGGRSVPMHGVKRIVDLGICASVRDLNRCSPDAITEPIGETPRQLIAPEIAAQMDQLLAAVVQQGTGRAAGSIADARGKTGTTDNGVDVLFIGYSPSMDLLTAIWMGNDDNRPAATASGGLVAELWGRYMLSAGHRR